MSVKKNDKKHEKTFVLTVFRDLSSGRRCSFSHYLSDDKEYAANSEKNDKKVNDFREKSL